MRTALQRLLVAAALALAGVLTLASPPTARALSIDCDQSGIGCITQFGYTGASTWGYPVDSVGNNCTNYVAFRLARNGAADPGNLGDADAWASNAGAKGFVVNQTPAVGAVAWFSSASSWAPGTGHVAYVEDVSGTTLSLSDSNWEGGSKRWRVNRGEASYPTSFIHIKDVGPPAAVEPGTVPTPTTVADDHVTLSWAPLSGATSYRVLRGGTQIGEVAGLEFTDQTVTADTSFAYQVVGVAGGQAGAPSPVTPVRTFARSEGAGAWVDQNGDGQADYCRRVGAIFPRSFVRCLLAAGNGFGADVLSGGIDWGYESGRAWVDQNGDGRADYCRRVGSSFPQSFVRCLLSGPAGFGADIVSSSVDWGYETGRAWVDQNGDGRADYCRRVGSTSQSRVRCLLSSGSGFITDVVSPVVGWGFESGRAWVDQNGDGRADYCRRVGSAAQSRVRCLLSSGSGFGADILSPVIDWGYETGRAWVDQNGDGRADYCRRVGSAYPQSFVRCLLSSGSGFAADVLSAGIDWGYETGRAWVDQNGDGRADYCRRVGSAYPQSFVRCLLSSATGFGADIASSSVDWGFESGRAWMDHNGDGRADYCRRVGSAYPQSFVRCLLSSATGFGADVLSASADWGYDVRGSGWGRDAAVTGPRTPTPGAGSGVAAGPGTTGGGAPGGTPSRAGSALNSCRVPALGGLTPAAARRKLVRNGCTLGPITYVGRKNPRADKVIRAKRRVGLVLKRGTKIGIVVRR